MYAIDFRKERQQEILSAIENGTPIPAPRESGWNRYEMLQVAGAMYAAIWSHGPVSAAEAKLGDLAKYKHYIDTLTAEHPDATEEALTRDVHNAIELCGTLTFMIMKNEYDQYNEPHVQILGSGKQGRFVKGGKKQ
jgi:hypothetical protein